MIDRSTFSLYLTLLLLNAFSATFRRLNPSYTLPISRPNVPAHMQGFQMPQQGTLSDVI